MGTRATHTSPKTSELNGIEDLEERAVKKIILVAVLALFACAQENDRSAAATSATGEAGPVDNAALLDELFEAYFEEFLKGLKRKVEYK